MSRPAPILNAAKLRKIREKQGEAAYARELMVPWATEDADLACLVEMVHRHAEAADTPGDSAGQPPMPAWFVEASALFMERYGRNRGAAILLKTLARLNAPVF